MNKLYILFLLFILSVGVYGQGSTCADADPFCTGTTYNFPNNTGLPDAETIEPGNNYGCLSTSPNPAWYYMEISTAGDLDIFIEQNTSAGGGLDVDFILYGPYDDLNHAISLCGNLGYGTSGSDPNAIVDCSYSTASTETANITNAQVGEVYLMLITNFSDDPGFIEFSQTGGTGATNCNILFPCLAFAGKDTSLCLGESYVLGEVPASSGNGNINYSWTPSEGLNDSTLSNPTATPSQTTTYYLTTIDDSSCVATDSVTIEVFQYPIADAGSDDTLKCTISQLTLDGSLSVADNFLWSTTDGNIVSGSTSSSPVIDQPGTYILETVNGGLCMDYDTVVIYQDLDSPIAEAGIGGTLTCDSSSLMLDGNGSELGSNISYSWSGGVVDSGINSLTPTISSPGVYTLTVTNNSNGCETTDTVTVFSDTISPSISISSPPSICPDSSVSLFASSNGDTFQWSTSNGEILSADNLLNVDVKGGGLYTLMATDSSNGCSSQQSVTVSEIPVSAIISANPTSGIAPLTVEFTNTGVADSSYWNFGNGEVLGDSSNNSSGTIIYEEQGNYEVVLTSFNGGCQTSVKLMIEVIGTSFITVPNVFTPNGDGQNDVFEFILQNISELKCVIFNRWGKKVAELTEPNSVWDGKINGGAEASDGTYYYILNANGTDDEEYELKGTVSLIR